MFIEIAGATTQEVLTEVTMESDDKDMCEPNPCKNEGACINEEHTQSFACLCFHGYAGSTCEIGKY